MSDFSLAKNYTPADHEATIYDRWEQSGAFQPSDGRDGKPPFSIILPPPNANGHIHMGTAMFVIEDIMARYRRMQGHPTLWLPGMDHAGIETQVVYERKLQAEGISRFDLGRDEFTRQVTTFTHDNKQIMIAELKSMGFSLDWSRLQFTLDDQVVATVYETFKRLHDAGYLYRGNRLVNWCPYCRSAFADIEIKYREQLDPLYYIKYGPFVLATVRPETKFGDTAIAVNPKDERYAKYVGQTITAEDLSGPIELKVIADDFVDPDFGTGVVKVTPAHDPNDWEMGLRHNLEVRAVIGTDGLLTEAAGKYAGMPVAEARAQVAHDLEARGLIDHIDMNYAHSVGYHDRCGTLIEPLVTEQWWLNVDELKRPVIAAIEQEDVAFVPSRFKHVALDWMENLRDWNVSRQNWYGIRIPVYYNATGDTSLPDYIVAATDAEAEAMYGKAGFEPETDIFDTWFSSGQWPFATLMASGEGDFERFYPSTVMETGRDLIFLWVTRMIMFGLFRTGQVPFRTVYLHGLITDGRGKKMSKSRGNVINPLDMTSKYGTDAVRLALTIGITPGNDGAVSEAKIEGYRNFCNKLWNVARFILGSLPNDYSPATPTVETIADAWIYERLNEATVQITAAIEGYRFSEAGELAYSLLWNDFADWYLEVSKGEQNANMLIHGLETILELVHPIAPFVTEAIWRELPERESDLIVASWPVTTKPKHQEGSAAFSELKDMISQARIYLTNMRPTAPRLHCSKSIFDQHHTLIARLLRLPLEAITAAKIESGFPIELGVGCHLVISMAEAAAYRLKLEADLAQRQSYVRAQEAKLKDKNFTDRAPERIVQQTKDSIERVRGEYTGLGTVLEHLRATIDVDAKP